MPERRELMDRIKGAEREYYAVAHDSDGNPELVRLGHLNDHGEIVRRIAADLTPGGHPHVHVVEVQAGQPAVGRA